MYQNGEGLDEKQRTELQKMLVQAIISALETGRITTEQMRTAANYILEKVDRLENKAQCLVFLEDLKTKWPIFEMPFSQYKHVVLEEKEKEVMNKLSQFIKTL